MANSFPNPARIKAPIPYDAPISLNGQTVTFGSGRASNARAATLAPMPASAPAKAKAGGSFIGNLGGDIVSSIEGLPTGIEAAVTHPIRAAQAIGKSYSQTYSPLIRGNFGEFAHNVYAHPLGPIMDALTIATLGGSALGHVANLAVDAGGVTANAVDAAANASRLSRLGKAGELSVPDYAQQAGQISKEGAISVRQTSANPFTRMLQNIPHKIAVGASNTAIKTIGKDIPVVGNTARGTRALIKTAEHIAAGAGPNVDKAEAAFNVLNKPERMAFHLVARGIHPDVYKAHLLENAVSGMDVSPTTLKLLDNPRVASLFEKPSTKLQKALDLNRGVSQEYTHLKVAGGHVDELAALNAPLRHFQLISGGMAHNDIAKALATNGEQMPFYVKDIAKTQKSQFARGVKGYTQPDMVSENKAWTGALFNHGQIHWMQNPVTTPYKSFLAKGVAAAKNEELMKHAAVLDRTDNIPGGYMEIKPTRGTQTASFMQRNMSEQEHLGLGDGMAGKRDFIGPKSTENPRFVVPTEVYNHIMSAGYKAHPLISAPTSVWKHMVLGLRPAYMANITSGNSILAALQMAPGKWGPMAWTNQLFHHGLTGAPLSEEDFLHVFPEQKYSTFGNSVQGAARGASSTSKIVRGANKAYQGVMPATIKYENTLRRSLAEGWANATPEIQKWMRDNNTRDVGTALKAVKAQNPIITQAISRRVDDALGNYRTYSNFEKAIKTVVPFYGWNRHLTMSVARLATERPQVLDALANTGKYGKPQANKILKNLPGYLQGSVKADLPGWLGGTTNPKQMSLLTMSSLNPFNTLTDEGKIIGGLTGHPGALQQGSGTWPINPFAQGLIQQMTNTNLLTGNQFKKGTGNQFINTLESAAPQEGLFKDLLNGGTHPTKHATNRNTTYGQLMRLIGVPVENVRRHTPPPLQWITVPKKK